MAPVFTKVRHKNSKFFLNIIPYMLVESVVFNQFIKSLSGADPGFFERGLGELSDKAKLLFGEVRASPQEILKNMIFKTFPKVKKMTALV